MEIDSLTAAKNCDRLQVENPDQFGGGSSGTVIGAGAGGGIVGVVLLVVLAAVVIGCLRRRKKKRRYIRIVYNNMIDNCIGTQFGDRVVFHCNMHIICTDI